MSDDNSLQIAGIVDEQLEGALFRVRLRNGSLCVAYASSEMRLNFITVLPGDEVCVEFNPYDLSRGRIVSRESERSN